MKFESFNLNPQLLENIKALGYETPTPIQLKAIPPIMEGRDVVGMAQTGTGKTAAFALPMLHRQLSGPRRQLRALILGPTRELVEQIHEAVLAFGRNMGIHSVTIYGGVGMHPQIAGLQRGAEIAIACPGRLLDHMRQGTIRLSNIDYLVLDEADRMFDMGFLPDVRKILARLPTQRQTLLFSATIPREVSGLAREILRNPVTVQIAHARPAESVSHSLYPVHPHHKTPLLMAILKRTDRNSVLIFTRTKHRAERLAEQLSRVGHSTTCLQGNLSQSQRKAAMDGFRSGRFQIMVATDIAARGLDVSSISHVINFDMPRTVDDYTHRIGRTGRAAKTGDAFTLVTSEDEDVVRGIEKVLGSRIERRKLDGFEYSIHPPSSPHQKAGEPAMGAPSAPVRTTPQRRFGRHRSHPVHAVPHREHAHATTPG